MGRFACNMRIPRRLVAAILLSLSSAITFITAFDVADPSRRLSFGQLLAASLAIQQKTEQELPSVVGTSTSYEQTLAEGFPRAMTYSNLRKRVARILPRPDDPNASPILLATSLCCDEVNRGLDREFEEYYGNHFNLGGLAGFPFSGVTGFRAMASHIPDNGSALIIYGPHIGIDADGALGTIDRRGQHEETACCGSAVAALNYARQASLEPVNRVKSTTTQPLPLDLEQSQVNSLVLAQRARLFDAQNPMLELPYALFDMQDLMFRRIILEAASKAPITLLGGIQINTPNGKLDLFCPLRFDAITMGQSNRYRTKEMLSELLSS